MKTTYEKIFAFMFFARTYRPAKDNKLLYATRKMLTRLKAIEEEYNEERQEIEINNCLTDEQKSIVTDQQGRLRFTQEGMIKRNKEWKQLLQKQITVEPYIATEIPELNEEQREAFEGFVIPKPIVKDDSPGKKKNK